MKKIILGLVIVLGLSFCAVSGVDATETESSVFQYQETTISPVNIGAENLSYGMRSEVIRELQQILSKYSEIYPEGLTTGYFGKLTQQAVKRFQEKKGLLQTGIVDKYFMEFLYPADESESPISAEKDYCNERCQSIGYNYGQCRICDSKYYVCEKICKEGEVNIGSTSDCSVPPAFSDTQQWACCCREKHAGICTDSDGGINKYVKGTTCQPSGAISASGITKLFCKTDTCGVDVGGSTTISYCIEYYCGKNGVMMSKQIECVKGCQDGACASGPHPVDPEDCIGNGEVYKDWSGLQGRCCEGLHVIASGYRNNTSYCTSEICGNGKCQALENEWNCKEDCKTTTQPVNVQPVINMIKQAIEKLNLAIRMLGDLVAISVDSDGGTSSSSGGGGGTSSGE